jgi:hypothetical protein
MAKILSTLNEPALHGAVFKNQNMKNGFHALRQLAACIPATADIDSADRRELTYHRQVPYIACAPFQGEVRLTAQPAVRRNMLHRQIPVTLMQAYVFFPAA